ncbi:MAG: aldose epimerase family protein [Rhizobiaceae bacterium]
MDIFGQTADGEPVQMVEIAGGGLSARIMSWGAVVQDLRLKGHGAPLVLGFDNFDDYPAHSPYFGANAGRNINRIRDGELVIDGKKYDLDKNFLGKHNLHGGTNGIGTRNWTFVAVSKDEAVLEIRCPDGNMGFPGNLDVRCTYRCSAKGTLSVLFESVTDKPTVCNIAHHSYFNLEDGGSTDILDHRMLILAQAYLPTDGDLIPDGRVLPVAGSTHDFRESRIIRHMSGKAQTVYDNTWCLSGARGPMRHAAHAEAPTTGVTLDVFTGEPGLQFYTGETMETGPAGLTGKPYFRYAGFCLETQGWPDSTHFPYFPSNILRPGEVMRQESEYRFSRG